MIESGYAGYKSLDEKYEINPTFLKQKQFNLRFSSKIESEIFWNVIYSNQKQTCNYIFLFNNISFQYNIYFNAKDISNSSK